MRNRTFAGLCLPLLTLSLLCACGGEKNGPPQEDKPETGQAGPKKKQEPARKKASLPPGYPAELTLPPGFRPSNLNPGSGSVTGGGRGKRTYKSFELWKMMPANAPAIITHYKKLLTGLDYQGEWKGDGKTSARGQFTKGNYQVELSINEERFKFNLRVYE